MPETTEAKIVSLGQRRKLLRTFRKQFGITLDDLGELAGLSKAMLSRFESGKRDLSADAWSHLLEKISELVSEGQGNLTWDPARRLAGIAKARQTAARLGASVAQSIHSPTLAEQVQQYSLMPAKELSPEAARDLLEISQRLLHENAIIADKERFWRGQLDKEHAQNVGLKDLFGLREKKILTEEAEQQKIDALGLEKIPPVEETILREEIEQKSKRKGKPKDETDDDPLALSKAQHAAEMRRLGFHKGEK